MTDEIIKLTLKCKNCDKTMSWSKVILIEYIKQVIDYYEEQSNFCSRDCLKEYLNNDSQV